MSFELMDLDYAHSPEKTSELLAHRVGNTQSKLPAFRFADISRRNSLSVPKKRRDSASGYQPNTTQTTTQGGENPRPASSSRTASGYSNASTTVVHPLPSVDSGAGISSLSSVTGGPGAAHRAETCNTAPAGPHTASSPHILQENGRPRAKRAPASYSSNGLETKFYPPPAMSSLKSLKLLSQQAPEQSTSEWAQQQQQILASGYIKNNGAAKPERGQLSNKASSGASQMPATRKVTPWSARSSRGMESKGSHYSDESPEDEVMEDDRDQTLRALQGFPTSQRPTAASRMNSEAGMSEETPEKRTSLSGTGDLFLDLALEEMELQNSTEKKAKRDSAPERISRIALATNRSSLPNPTSRRTSATNPMNRSFDRDSVPSPYARTTEHAEAAPSQFAYDTAAAHSRATSIPQTQADIHERNYPPSANRANPMTPRVSNFRDARCESTSSAASKRDSAPSVAGSARTNAYQQSNLSSFSTVSTPRMYNFSSPRLRSAELGSDDGTISTTAPSTVWDELDHLKSRLNNLELTGRLPPTSRQSIRPSGERPPTATTTATTMSISPNYGRQLKRGRQISGAYSEDQGESDHEVAHPLLHAALAKSKTVLIPDIYRALETAAQDALDVASMVGSDGSQGFSSGQSAYGGAGGSIADRQLRRRADSMCQSLTELCIALLDSAPSSPATATARPMSREKELALQMQIASERERELKRSETSAGIYNRAKVSPSRALSRLEERRNSLLRETPQIGHRFDAGTSFSGTPGQPLASALAGRRTSFLLDRDRGETEDPDDSRMEDAQDFRAPSTATTEIGISRGDKRVERMRTSYRVRTPAYSPLMTDREREREHERIAKERERERPVSMLSNLPGRRTYAHLGSPTDSPSVMANRRRYLDRERGAPERDTSSVMERLALNRSNLSRLQNSEAVGLNRTRSAAGGTPVVSRFRARTNALGQNNDSNDTINTTRAEAGAFTQSFGL